MQLYIDKLSGEPAYIQLYKQLRQQIVQGNLIPGQKLPSKRLICEDLGISVITAEHAYSLLADEGYVSAVQRSGYYVNFGAAMTPESENRTHTPKQSSNTEKSTPFDFHFAAYAKTMRKVLSDYDSDILRKSENRGCPELRDAIAHYLSRSRGINVSPEQIIIGSGAEYLYSMVVQLLGRDSAYALESPSYEKIRKVYEANGATCTTLKLGHDGILSEELNSCTAGALHVTPYNSYPSGVTASAHKRHEYAQWAKANNRYIIEDDYDSEFSASLKLIDTIFSIAPECTIYINTFSRTIASSMRMGYMVLPPNLLKKYDQNLDFYSCTVPVYEQYVLAEFINSGQFERHINRCRRKLRSENRL